MWSNNSKEMRLHQTPDGMTPQKLFGAPQVGQETELSLRTQKNTIILDDVPHNTSYCGIIRRIYWSTHSTANDQEKHLYMFSFTTQPLCTLAVASFTAKNAAVTLYICQDYQFAHLALDSYGTHCGRSQKNFLHQEQEQQRAWATKQHLRFAQQKDISAYGPSKEMLLGSTQQTQRLLQSVGNTNHNTHQ